MPHNETLNFWRNLEKIQDHLLLNEVEFAASLGIKHKDYLTFKSSKKMLPIDVLFEMSEKMNFHFEDLLSADFVFKHDPDANRPLMDRYTLATHSQTRPIINILNYVELIKGTRVKTNLIRKFQLSEDFIIQEQNKTNILLISDIVKYLSVNHNFKKADFLAIGRRMPFIFSNSILRDTLAKHNTAFDILDCFVYECTRLFDTNCAYRISEKADDYAVIEVLPNKNVVEELMIDKNLFGNEEVCLTRMGNFSSVMYYKYGKNAQVKKVSSIHMGDQSNKYLLDLSQFKKMKPAALINEGRSKASSNFVQLFH
jgi:hypothetical protein